MNIILCYPPKRNYNGYGQDKRWLPLGIASLGAYIKREYPEINITLLDLFDYSIVEALKEIWKYINHNDINLVGLTCFTEQRINVFELCKKLKYKQFTAQSIGDDTQIYTIIGGAHAYLMSEQIANNYDFISHIVRAEGEKAWVDIIEHYKTPKYNLMLGRIIESDIIHDLDTLPHSIDGFELFANVPKEIEAEAPIVFSRGCTDYCSFCSTTKFWKGYRSRSASNVFNEMLKYNTKYGTTKFKFHDDASTADLDNWKNLCKLIIEFGYQWEFEITARADQFDDELINLLSLAGCKRVAVGIESGNEKLRKAMNKNLDIELAKINMKKLMNVGIEVVMLFIVGYPGESENTIQETIDLIKEVNPSSFCCQPLMIFPGTKVYRDCIKLGWISDDYWLEDLPQPYYTREQSWEKLCEWTKKLQTCLVLKNILICAPVNQDETIFKLYLESLRKLEIPKGYNVIKLFILHNCEHLKDYLKIELNESCMIYNNDNKYICEERTHIWEKENFKDVVFMKNKLLEIMLQSGFEYIFFVDSDLILNKNTLKQLISADKDIISEVFWTKWDLDNKTQPKLPNAWSHDSYNITEEDYMKWITPGIHKVGMTGACTLIKRRVIESGVNWCPISNVTYSYWEDRAFCIRANVMGFDIYMDTNYPAKHLYRKSDLEKYLKEC